MKTEDIQYLCTTVGNLCGIPIRLYENGKLLYFLSVSSLPKDPVSLCLDEIQKVKGHVGYYITPDFFYYGTVASGSYQIVLGPSRQLIPDEQEIRTLAFQLDVSPDDIGEFVIGMRSIIPMPLESMLLALCSVNFVLNGEKLTLSEIGFQEEVNPGSPPVSGAEPPAGSEEYAKFQEDNTCHNSYTLEENLTHIIRSGDVSALEEMVKNPPSMRSGKIAQNQLRQTKNLFVVTATLASRAAIRGGLDVEEALSMSDRYIQKSEQQNDVMSITSLQYTMIHDYTEKVQRIRIGKSPSKLVMEVANYVQHHLSEPISTEEMAKTLFLSRSRLSTKFRQQSGETLTDFILSEKVQEAKRLLRYSEKPIPAIASYLGFSSQSHFSRVFRKYTGQTPKEYYEKHKQ